DVVREFLYWDWLSQMRNVAAKELDPGGYGDERYYIYDREEYLEEKLTTLQAVNRQEAIDVCQWVLSEGRFDDRSDLTDRIILNLVGECANA
ncbi:helix-turn-helix domain-containing protein, partial [Xenorhabdus bovienii]|nr:helix-turn-helix domain-containing protein [Xenorhabdus bovienii]